MAELTCEEFAAVAAEVALGVADGEERAAALAHAARCAACQEQLRALGALADRLVELTPSVEPPVGFEARVLSRLQARSRRHWRRPLPRALAAAAVAVAIGLAGWAVGHRSTPHPPASPVASAALVAGGEQVGQVTLQSGSHPWVSMAVERPLGVRSVTCQVTERDGRVVTVGRFTLYERQGYWAAPVPGGSPVVSARLVAPDGATVASARLG